MEIDLIFKIAAIGLTVAILNQLLSRSNRDEYAVLTTLAGLVIVVLMLIPRLGEVFSEIREIFEL